MANIILETKITNLSPTLWYGQNAVDKYNAIIKVISAKIGDEYASIFSQPQLSESALKGYSTARWLSNHIGSNAQRFTDLDQNTYQNAIKILQKKLDKVTSFGNTLLLSEKDENVKWGQLILKIVTYPDESYLYYENGKVAITAWGFKLNDPSLAITGYSREFANKEINTPKSVSESELKHEPEPSPKEVNNEIDKVEVDQTLNEEKLARENKGGLSIVDNEEPPLNSSESPEKADELKVEQEEVIEHENEDQKIRDEDSASTDEIEKTSLINKYRWWLLLLLLLLLGALLFFIFYKPIGSGDIPPQEVGQVIKPIDPVTIITSPDSITNIVSDRLNVALHGQNKDIDIFCKNFKKLYPSSDYSVIYKDPKTARVQIQVPSEELSSIKNSLESKMSGYQLLIWHESIFQKNAKFNDPGFLDNNKSWYFDEVQAKEAWDITQGDEDVVIAVLDSGFDLNHPELINKVYKPWDVTTRSSTIIYNSKHSMHGTHVASISAANADNKTGVSGIAPKCKIMPVKVGDSNGTLASSYVVDGFLYALNNGADVINMSLGLYVHPSIEKLPEEAQREIIRNNFKDEEEFWNLLFDIALANNVAVVLAGGNQNVLIGIDPLDRSNYPIRVSATDVKGTKASFSNWGDYSDISAPGDKIYNAVGDGTYGFLSGTSMAAPIVSGAVGLLKSVKQDLRASDIKHILKSTGKVAFAPSDRRIGNIIQIKDALLYAQTGTLPSADCTDIQDKIDSLNREIEKLKLECGGNTQVDTLQFPKAFPKSDDFAKGRWKSTSTLLNTISLEPVELYFDFYGKNEGNLTLVEKKGTICRADLEVSISNSQLIFDQTKAAICDNNSTYNSYKFSCKSNNQGTAVCIAKNKATNKNDVEFLLVKIR